MRETLTGAGIGTIAVATGNPHYTLIGTAIGGGIGAIIGMSGKGDEKKRGLRLKLEGQKLKAKKVNIKVKD